MGPLGWLLLVIAALIAICMVVIRKTSAQQRMAGIGPNDESMDASDNIYRSRAYYPSSVTSDVLSDMLVGGTASSVRAHNGNGSANCSEATASSPDSTSSSDDDECNDDDSSSSSDSSSSCDSGSSFDSGSSDSSSSFDSGSSSDSGSSDS